MRNGGDDMEPTKIHFSWLNVIPVQEEFNCSWKSVWTLFFPLGELKIESKNHLRYKIIGF